MTDKGFIKRLSKRTGITQKELRVILDEAEMQLKQDLIDGSKRIKVLDLNFYTKVQPERQMHYFDSGEKVILPEQRKVRMSMSTDWHDILNNYTEYETKNKEDQKED